MGKGNRNRVIRKESIKVANGADQPFRAGEIARRSRKDLNDLVRKGKRIRFTKIGEGEDG